MKDKNKYTSIFSVRNFNNLLLLLAFIIPVSKPAVVFVCYIILAFWIIGGQFNNKIICLKENYKPALWLGGLYIFYITGMIYTSNLSSGWFDLQVKSTLFFIPLLLFSLDNSDEQRMDKIMKAFVTGNIVAALTCIVIALANYINTGNQSYFFYAKFSVLHHPSYQAMYVCFAISYLLNMLICEFSKWKINQRIFNVLTLILLTIYVILLNSKMGILSLALVFIANWFYLTFIIRKYKTGISFFILLAVFLTSIVLFVPSVKYRFSMTKSILDGTYHDRTESSQERLDVWKAAISLTKQNIVFGYGTGDTKDVLIAYYKEHGVSRAVEKRLNAHNQFLQTTLSIGIFAVLLLLSFLIIPFFVFSRRIRFIYAVFIMIIFINFFVESMLETQAGVVFFAFFNTLLFLDMKRK